MSKVNKELIRSIDGFLISIYCLLSVPFIALVITIIFYWLFYE